MMTKAKDAENPVEDHRRRPLMARPGEKGHHDWVFTHPRGFECTRCGETTVDLEDLAKPGCRKG
jgi:hypothetical protein